MPRQSPAKTSQVWSIINHMSRRPQRLHEGHPLIVTDMARTDYAFTQSRTKRQRRNGAKVARPRWPISIPAGVMWES